MTEVAELGAGMSFGELALLNDKPRNATIMCKENTEFAVLEKVHYKELLGNG